MCSIYPLNDCRALCEGVMQSITNKSECCKLNFIILGYIEGMHPSSNPLTCALIHSKAEITNNVKPRFSRTPGVD